MNTTIMFPYMDAATQFLTQCFKHMGAEDV